MDNQTLPVNGGTNTDDQIPAPPTYSSCLTRSQIKSSYGTLVPGIDNRKTPSRTRLVGNSNGSSNSISSSGTSSSTDSSIFDDSLSRAGTQTPPTDDESSDSMGVVSRRLSRVEINNESPVALKEKRNHRKLAKVAEEARSVAGISEAFRALDLQRKSNDPESAQEPEGLDEAIHRPEEIDEVVVSGASHGPQPGQLQQIPLGAADTALSEEVEIGSAITSGTSLPSEKVGTALVPEKVDEQVGAATALATKPPRPVLAPDETTESALEDRLDAKASSNVNRQGDFVEGLGSTFAETVTPLRDLPKGETRRSSRVKENAAAKEAAAKEAREKEAREKEARENETTATAATGVDHASTGKIPSPQSSRKGKGTHKKASDANATSSAAAAGQSRRSTKRSPPKSQGAGLDDIPIFSDYGKQLTVSAIHHNILEVLEYNGKDKTKSQTTPKVETKSPGKGYVYIYTSPQCSSHVKIGMTSNTPHARVSQWDKKCKLETTLMEDSENHKFLHFQLAEKLIQNELHNYRRKYSCHSHRVAHRNPGQGDTNMMHHGEWYEISEELGLATVQKWRRWLVTNGPYNTNGVLRPTWKGKYDDLIKKTTLVDREEWVEAWVQPLTIKETVSYFWIHCIETTEDTSSKIQKFLRLASGQLTHLRLICDEAIGLSPFFGRVVLVLIAACFIHLYKGPLHALFFVIFFIFMRFWMTK
ncbi:hypothetical protein ACLOAV_006101 [Pseudogymnoascus australis]